MALGDLTRKLAGEAIAGTLRSPKPETPAAVLPDDPCATIIGEVQAMQKALKDDEELVVFCKAANEVVRVQEIFVPSRSVVVLTGQDAEKNVTRIVSHIEALQLLCKLTKAPPGITPNRINFVAPRQK